MKSCILIGFKYQGNYPERERLPSTEMDLYVAYKFAMKCKPNNILVITDVVNNPNAKLYISKVIEGKIPEDFLCFIDDIKDAKHYVEYKSKKQLITLLDNVVNMSDNVFLYISSHGLNGEILLPKKSSITNKELRNIIIPRSDKSLKYLVVVDCCQFNGSFLPFSVKYGDYRTNNLDAITETNVILFSSSNITGRSISRYTGSDFTMKFFDIIEKTKDVIDIIKQTDCYVFSTNIIFKLWLWIYGYEIDVKLENNCIVVERICI